MFIAILGRQPEISLAELQAVHGPDRAKLVAPSVAQVNSERFELADIGGSLKYGQIIQTIAAGRSDQQSLEQASHFITNHYTKLWGMSPSKITLGLSSYNLSVSPRDIQKIGLVLKTKLKRQGVSLRLIPNSETSLSTATSHNNKLGLSTNKVELLIIKTNRSELIIAESRGSQNIAAYAKRDHGRPGRDAFVGMLPPKLAQIMLNLAVGSSTTHPNSPISQAGSPNQSNRATKPAETTATPFSADGGSTEIGCKAVSDGFGGEDAIPKDTNQSSRTTKSPEQSAARVSELRVTETRSEAALGISVARMRGQEEAALTVLDPFCGTGTVLQEAMLRGFSVYGSDLNPKMINLTQTNLDWLQRTHKRAHGRLLNLETADATNHTWQNAKQIDLIVSELYLGQPLSGLPSSEKLQQIVNNCDHIASQFLKNIRPQLSKSAKLCLALPAWQIDPGKFIQLPLISQLGSLGFERINFSQLIYHRPDQIVAREILVLAIKD